MGRRRRGVAVHAGELLCASELRAQSTTYCRIGYVWRPSAVAAYSCECSVLTPRLGTIERMLPSEMPTARMQEVRCGVLGNFAGVRAQLLAKDLRDFGHSDKARDLDEELAGGFGGNHRGELKRGDVANVDKAEAGLQDGRLPLEHALDQLEENEKLSVGSGPMIAPRLPANI